MGSIKDVATEELLEAVGQDKSTVFNIPSEEQKSLREFIREYGIIEGKSKVPGYQIYYEYCKVWKPTGNKLSKIDFLRRFNKYFKVKRTKTTRYYMLKRGIFSLDKDDLENAKKFNERYERKIKKNKKVKREVSSSEEEVQPQDETGLHRT
jgi:hypothetical protein